MCLPSIHHPLSDSVRVIYGSSLGAARFFRVLGGRAGYQSLLALCAHIVSALWRTNAEEIERTDWRLFTRDGDLLSELIKGDSARGVG